MKKFAQFLGGRSEVFLVVFLYEKFLPFPWAVSRLFPAVASAVGPVVVCHIEQPARRRQVQPKTYGRDEKIR